MSQGRGNWEGRGPPNFLSQWDGYACAPLNFGNHYRHINIFAPPPEKNRSRAPVCRYNDLSRYNEILRRYNETKMIWYGNNWLP